MYLCIYLRTTHALIAKGGQFNQKEEWETANRNGWQSTGMGISQQERVSVSRNGQ